MSAKPQPMAGQSDAADDLIAELAKLMAQDAQGERPAQPTRPTFSVRIPGGDTPPLMAPVSTDRFDLDAFRPEPEPEPVPVQAAPVQAEVVAEVPEPFHFDFFNTPKRPEPAAPVAAAQPEPQADHDTIADLIAAEFDREPPTPEPVAVAPPPLPAVAPPPMAAPPPAAAVEARPAQQPTSGWAPTAVAPNLGAQDKPAAPALRSLNLQPAPRSEPDRFKVPPVFGLASKPAEPTISPVAAAPVEVAAPAAAEPLPAPQPVQAAPMQATAPKDDGLSDPIDEIENLIGRAMRVEFERPAATPPTEAPPAQSPAPRSLATPTLPATDEAQPARALSGADEAILAAAQATGAQIGWVDSPEQAEARPAPAAVRPRSSSVLGMTRAVAGPLVAVTLLLAAGFGLYWVLGLGTESGPAPLLTADATPIKETPVAQPEAEAPQQSVVFNEIDGVVPGAEEQLVSRDQADVNEVTQIPPTAELSEEGLANRKVRTVTVRPDGTIVSGDDSVAGSAILPVDRPNVPEVPGAETASPELLAAAEPAAATPTPATATTPDAVAPDATATPAAEATDAIAALVADPDAEIAPAAEPEPTLALVTPGSIVPAVDVAGNPLAGKTAPVPLVRSAALTALAAAMPPTPVEAMVQAPVSTGGGNMLPPPPTTSLLGPTPTTATTTTPASAPTPASAAVAETPAPSTTVPGAVEVEALPNSAPAYVQLASQRSEAEARATAQAMVTRYGPLFGGANMEVQRVDLGAKGIYYRVRVPANSMQEANNICTNVKAAGGDCFTM